MVLNGLVINKPFRKYFELKLAKVLDLTWISTCVLN